MPESTRDGYSEPHHGISSRRDQELKAEAGISSLLMWQIFSFGHLFNATHPFSISGRMSCKLK